MTGDSYKKFALGLLLLYGCGSPSPGTYSYDPAGYYYRLITFQNQKSASHNGCVAHVSLTFKTQLDSLFWDSRNNYSDRFYMSLDESSENLLVRAVSRAALLDSMEVLLPAAEFFNQQFRSTIPFFSVGDSVVKASFMVKKIHCGDQVAKIRTNLKQEEERMISAYLSTLKTSFYRDASGVIWLEGRPDTSSAIKPGQTVTVGYRGSFLNGRFLDQSGVGFEMVYGTPDQLLPGLNYVIGRLKLGQSAKIILPSPLAFGNAGSSNGSVPPCTPLIYEIRTGAPHSMESE